MSNRCQKCGVVISFGKVCNHCLIVREEKDFLKMADGEMRCRVATTPRNWSPPSPSQIAKK